MSGIAAAIDLAIIGGTGVYALANLDDAQAHLPDTRYGAPSGPVRIATLAVKQHGRCVPGLCADYAGVDVPDRYVFGYGMDYHEQGRNLPGIYALVH